MTATTVVRTDDAVVRAAGVRRTFGDREVLRGLDLALRPGEFVALLGRSGSGKSTLLRALAGLDPRVEGDITVPRARSVVFQDARLLPWASVLDNVVLGLAGPAAEAATAGRSALAEVGLGGHEDDWPKTLSGGAKPSERRWPGRSSGHRSCSCWTSRSVRSTPSPGSACTHWSSSSTPATSRPCCS